MDNIKLIRFFILLVFSLVLISCKKDITYEYLMQHPMELQNKYAYCMEEHDDNMQCEMIKKALRDFSQLVDERNSNPEEFGHKIMQLQMALTKSAETNQQEEYQKQLQQLDVLYAVYGYGVVTE